MCSLQNINRFLISESTNDGHFTLILSYSFKKNSVEKSWLNRFYDISYQFERESMIYLKFQKLILHATERSRIILKKRGQQSTLIYVAQMYNYNIIQDHDKALFPGLRMGWDMSNIHALHSLWLRLLLKRFILSWIWGRPNKSWLEESLRMTL